MTGRSAKVTALILRLTLRGFPIYREALIKGTISDEVVSLCLYFISNIEVLRCKGYSFAMNGCMGISIYGLQVSKR